MPSRSISLLIAACGLAGVGVWLVLAGGRGKDMPPAPEAGTAAGPDVAGGAPLDSSGVAAGAANVHVAVRRVGGIAGGLAADAPPPCRLVDGDRVVPCAVSIVAGPPDRVGRHFVRFRFADGSALWRVVWLADEPVDVRRFAPALVEGRVVDESGSPIAGAEVWTGTTGPGGEPSTTTTGADGRFVAAGVDATSGVPVVVHAAGHASHWREVDLQTPMDRPLLLQLAVSASVEVAVLQELPSMTAGVVRLVPVSEGLELRHYPFLWGAVEPATLALDARGVLRVDDLPRDSRVRVVVEHPAVSGPSASAEVVLHGPATRAIVRPPPAAFVAGRVVDPDGRSIAEARVRVGDRAGAPSPPGYLLPVAGDVAFPVGADGSFRVPVPPGGIARVSVDAPGRQGVSVEVRAGASTGDVVLHSSTIAIAKGSPALELRLPDGEWHADLEGIGELRWLDPTTLAVALSEPCVVDVDVRADGPGEPFRRTWRGLPVVGATVLDITP